MIWFKLESGALVNLSQVAYIAQDAKCLPLNNVNFWYAAATEQDGGYAHVWLDYTDKPEEFIDWLLDRMVRIACSCGALAPVIHEAEFHDREKLKP